MENFPDPTLVDERDITDEIDDVPVFRVAVMTGYYPQHDSWGRHAWWEFPSCTALPAVIEWAHSVKERPSKIQIWLVQEADVCPGPDEEFKKASLLHTVTFE